MRLDLADVAHRLVDLVVKASTSRAADLDFYPCSHTSDFKVGNPVAALPGAWRYRVNVGTGWPGPGVLLLGETESLISTSISVWQHLHFSEQARP